MISRIGRSPTGFGRIVVYGRSRIPNSPTRTTAFMQAAAYRWAAA
jgi:hypothetical protein